MRNQSGEPVSSGELYTQETLLEQKKKSVEIPADGLGARVGLQTATLASAVRDAPYAPLPSAAGAMFGAGWFIFSPVGSRPL